MKKLAYLTLTWSLVLATNLYGEKPPGFQKLEIGQPAPDFKLRGIDNRDWTLAEVGDSKVLLVYFTSNHCLSLIHI